MGTFYNRFKERFKYLKDTTHFLILGKGEIHRPCEPYGCDSKKSMDHNTWGMGMVEE